jgi:hypothetical protein
MRPESDVRCCDGPIIRPLNQGATYWEQRVQSEGDLGVVKAGCLKCDLENVAPHNQWTQARLKRCNADVAATDDPSFTIISIALAAGVLFGSREEASGYREGVLPRVLHKHGS